MVLAATPILATPVRAQSVAPPLEDRAQAVECLSLAIAYEAGFESQEGQQAVAEVILNRVRHPGFPKSICGVVFAGSTRQTGCQFTFTCDGSLRRHLPEAVFARARAIAGQAIDGQLPSRVGEALNYHADYVSPRWAPKLERVTKIGAHIFYRPRGAGEIPGALAVPIGVAGGSPLETPVAKTPSPAIFAPWGLAPAATSPAPAPTAG